MKRAYFFLIFFFVALSASAIGIDTESGVVLAGLNDVSSPNGVGTRLSLTRDLHINPTPFFRLQLTTSLGGRHTLRFLYAPLSLVARGVVDRDVVFEDAFFPAGTPIEALYRFDSYRLTWRYALKRRPGLEFAAGITAKVRDAETSLFGAARGVKTNTGFVPLLNLHLDWKPGNRRTGLLVDVDAAAAKQGRAEDVLVALTRTVREGIEMRVGYRMLEGGADVPEVYSFAWLHYVVWGLSVRL